VCQSTSTIFNQETKLLNKSWFYISKSMTGNRSLAGRFLEIRMFPFLPIAPDGYRDGIIFQDDRYAAVCHDFLLCLCALLLYS